MNRTRTLIAIVAGLLSLSACNVVDTVNQFAPDDQAPVESPLAPTATPDCTLLGCAAGPTLPPSTIAPQPPDCNGTSEPTGISCP